MRVIITALILGFAATGTVAQTTFPANGAPYNPQSAYAFINAAIWSDPETFIANGTLLIKEGSIVAVGEKVEIPANAIVYDLKGKYIYPSFIDIFSEYGLPETRYPKKQRPGPQMESNVKGAYGWNQAIRSENASHKLFSHNKQAADELKKIGFASVLSCPRDGIVRGSGVLLNLANKSENESVIIDKAAAYYSFFKGSSTQDYPSSLTGAIALMRQTYYDAGWYEKNKTRTEYNISLEEFNKLKSLPSVFEAGDKFNALRAAKIGKEFNVQYIIKGSGNEYQRISEIRETGLSFIIPLDFPEAYDVEDPFQAESVSLAELKHWELAPANAAILEKNNVSFCLTSADLKDKGRFLKNLRKAVQYGLSEKAALNALTINPAKYVNVSGRIGALRKGYYANFFICEKSFFSEETPILQHWVAGEPEIYDEIDRPDIRGMYTLNINPRAYKVSLTGEAAKPKGQVTVDTSRKTFSYSHHNNLFSFSFMTDTVNVVRGSGTYHREGRSFDGSVQNPDGSWSVFSMIYESAVPDDTSSRKKENPDISYGQVIYPFTAYGKPLPEEKGNFFSGLFDAFRMRYSALLIKDATVWTNQGDSVLREYDVYIVDGKIVRVAPEIDAPVEAFAKVINGKGMHLTPGIIDEHSHIAISAGVNEGTQASSAEVRMGDVINPDDVNIYRLLAGGVTTSQLLHGSANPIGGQSALIKLRWGLGAEQMKFENADPFIKFALGENVKQSNWGDLNVVRFPQTRMGVEQVYTDHFIRAREYDRKMGGAGQTTGTALRRDLELEALAEILNKKRFITCHSYVQSEINMLMHLADSFGFRVNTFTHILEGYKVADKMKAHGANASTFSDWWAYKNEVVEAIPYNAAILTRVGVNTAINSDDAEMARRLNQEAAKCMKYGGLSETEALKLVTLNPAKMLHIDDRVGSIQPGKTADMVLWTDHPLSVYARADKTIIDGKIYFDREEDDALRKYIQLERARIINKLIAEKHKGAKTVKPQQKKPKLYHCDTLEEETELYQPY